MLADFKRVTALKMCAQIAHANNFYKRDHVCRVQSRTDILILHLCAGYLLQASADQGFIVVLRPHGCVMMQHCTCPTHLWVVQLELHKAHIEDGLHAVRLNAGSFLKEALGTLQITL